MTLMSDIARVRWATDQLGITNPAVAKAWSGDSSVVYEITSGAASWFLKIGAGLGPERERIQWLRGRLPVPEVVAFADIGGKDALLTTTVPGTNLARLAKRLPAADIVAMLAAALRLFHGADATGCPFEAAVPGGVVVHGDACLPNVMVRDDGSLSGFVDLGEMGAGDIEVDLAAAVWSLQYNLGPGHGLNFLRAYGLTDSTERDVGRLWRMYAAI